MSFEDTAYTIVHPHDERFFSVVRIADGEMADVRIWSPKHLAVRNVVGRPAYVPEADATFCAKTEGRYERASGWACGDISPSDPPVTTPRPLPHHPSTQTASTIPHLSPSRQQSSPQCRNLFIGSRLLPMNRES